MPQAAQLSALAPELRGMPESQPMMLSAEAEDTTAVVASTAAVNVIRILTVQLLQWLGPALTAARDLRPIGSSSIGAGA